MSNEQTTTPKERKPRTPKNVDATTPTTTATKGQPFNLKALMTSGVNYIGLSADDGIDKGEVLKGTFLTAFATDYDKKPGREKRFGNLFGLFKTDKGTKKAVLDPLSIVIPGEQYEIIKTIRTTDGQNYHGYQIN